MPAWARPSLSHLLCSGTKSQMLLVTNTRPPLVCSFQLPFVIHSGEPEFIGGLGVYPVRMERLGQCLRLAILVQLDPDSTHGKLLRSRHMCGLRRRGS